MNLNYRGVKCVAVGDPAVGKTSLFTAITSGGFIEEYRPTTFENFHYNFRNEDGKTLSLYLWDTAGQDELAELRTLCYSNTDVFFMVFSVGSRNSFENLPTKWWQEVKEHAKETPIILVGTKIDLRKTPSFIKGLTNFTDLITYEQGASMAKELGCIGYLECSALTHEGILQLVEQTVKLLSDTFEKGKHKNSAKKRKITKKNCIIM